MAGAITIDALEIVIEKKATSAAQQVTNLANALKELKSALSGSMAKKFENLSANLTSFQASIEKLDVDKLTRMAAAMEKIALAKGAFFALRKATSTTAKEEEKGLVPYESEFGYANSTESDDYKRLNGSLGAAEQAANATNEAKINVDDFLDRATPLDVMLGKLKSLKEQLGTLINSGDPEKSKDKIISLTGQIQKLESQIIKATPAVEEQTKGIDSLGDTTNNAEKRTTKLNKTMKILGASLARVALYRAIRSVIKAITEALTEGINSAYTYSRLVGGTFATTMDNITTSVFYLKTSIGAALIPIIEALEPVIVEICDRLAEFANQLSAVGALISGKSVYTVATKQLKQYVEYAKKAQNLTLGIDEINAVSNNDKTDYSTLFTEESTENASEFAKIIAEICTSIGNIVVYLVDIIKPILSAFLPATGTFLISIIELVGDLLTALNPVIQMVSQFVASVLTAIMPIIEPIIAGIITIVEAFTPFIAQLYEKLIPSVSIYAGDVEKVLIPLLQIVVGIATKLMEIVNYFTPAISSIIDNLVYGIGLISTLFSGLYHLVTGQWDLLEKDTNDLCENIKGLFKSAFEVIKNVVFGIMNGIITIFEVGINAIISAINLMTSTISEAWTWTGLPAIPAIPRVSFTRFANGGFPEEGQLFVANESGAEMVGSMDGKTAVANNQQIVDGIKAGVFEAMMSALSTQQESGGDFNITIDLDGKQLESRITSITKSKGYSINNGAVFA